MLKTLTVENFALIENIMVEFGTGLNILTGETGAGKSILIEALGTILGKKISTSKIRKGANYLRVEAKFLIDGKIFTIERKISRSEKNSITLDGTPISLAKLKKFCAALVDIHEQNKNLELLREEKVYSLIDDEEITAELKIFSVLYHELNSKTRVLEKKMTAFSEQLQRLDFLCWQEKEISSAALKPDEDEKLDAEIKKLSHAEKIAENVYKAAQLLNDDDTDILTALAKVEKSLNVVLRYDDKLISAHKLLEEAQICLREAYDEIRNYSDSFDFSLERLSHLQERADLIFKLKRKYGVSVNDILQRLENIRSEIAEIENFDSDVEELKTEIAALELQTKSCAEKIFKLRQMSARILSEKIERELQHLGMARAQFEIVVESSKKLNKNGGDKLEIFFCANFGEERLPLSKVVSGGELSRIALAVKIVSTLEQRSEFDQVIIFDEIDTGLGGATAKTVAECIVKISSSRQVLCITHLPQIASVAQTHLQITKAEIDGRTVTKVKQLNFEERVREIARMVSGEESLISIKNAREMLKGGTKGQ